MKSVQESTTLVVVGRWNRHVLSPNWVAKNLFHVEKMIVEFAIGNELPPRYSHEEIRFLPMNDRVILVCLDEQTDVLARAEAMARELVKLLQHTPVTGLGCNFGYTEEATADLLKMFDLPFNSFFGDHKYEVKKYTIHREIHFNDCTLNLQTTTSNGEIKFDLNFDYPMKSSASILEMPENFFSENRARGLKLLEEVYSIKQEEVEQQI